MMMMIIIMMMMMMQVTVRMEEPRYNRIFVSVKKLDPPHPDNMLVRIGKPINSFPCFFSSWKMFQVCKFVCNYNFRSKSVNFSFYKEVKFPLKT